MKIEERNQNLSDFGFDALIKKYIEECVDKVVDNRFYSLMCKIAEEKAIENNKTLTAKELCNRWNISDNTLRSRENAGIIHPLETGGKKKIYSMKDIRNVEASGILKSVC
jgi:hypothetical protein